MTDDRQAGCRNPEAAGVPRAAVPFAAVAALAFVLWNGVFDLLVTRGVKEYLYRAAEHELGRGPAVTMNGIMGRTIADAAVTASLWALSAGAAGALIVALARREARASCTR